MNATQATPHRSAHEQIIAVLRVHLPPERQAIRDDEDLELDSLQMVAVMVDLEEAFGTQLAESAIRKETFRSLRSIAACLGAS